MKSVMKLNEFGRKLSSNRKIKIAIIIIIGFVALCLRVNLAVNGLTEYDEKIYMRSAIFYGEDIRTGNWSEIIHSQYNYEHPIFNKLIYSTIMVIKPMSDTHLSIGTKITHEPTYKFIRLLAFRLISVLFGTLAVIIMSLINPAAGLFLAVHTFSVKYTSVIYLEALPLLLSILSVMFFMKYLEKSEIQGNSRKHFVWGILSAVALGLTVASKYIYGVAGLALVIYAVYKIIQKKQPKLLGLLGIWLLIAGISFFLANPVIWSNPIGQIQKSLNFSVAYSEEDTNVVTSDYPFWQPFKWIASSIPQQSYGDIVPFFSRDGDFPVQLDTFIAILAVIGLYRLFKDKPIYFIWLVLGWIFLLLWRTKWPQYILVILPPFCLSAGLAVDSIVSLLGSIFRRIIKDQSSGK
jgi:hypothetical protein